MKIERVIERERKQVRALVNKLSDRLIALDKASIVLNGHQPRKRRMSAAARDKISKAQRARWAKTR